MACHGRSSPRKAISIRDSSRVKNLAISISTAIDREGKVTKRGSRPNAVRDRLLTGRRKGRPNLVITRLVCGGANGLQDRLTSSTRRILSLAKRSGQKRYSSLKARVGRVSGRRCRDGPPLAAITVIT